MGIRWESLDEANQLALAQAALERAVAIVAERAERLADQMEQGVVADLGGADALRLFACFTRSAASGREPALAYATFGQVGHA